ncbi:hypothetical protein Ahy_B01g053454 isoform A [Arachis hypogaea]|uniref:t-SNARE coiled-coil homology domain-containing protein n=1 Tax=Arachis hypogaea TaxID=3818 RepID=A0A445ARV6_ARAHY|nr:hypothetical protein Ahy_B01g053454 isoform A [Arachis hypogaea]
MDQLSAISEELAEIDGRIADNFRSLANGFQKLDKIKDSSRQSRQLEDLTDKMRDSKRLIKEFDKEVKALEANFDRETTKMLNDKKQSMIKELNSYVALKKQYASNIENKKIELFEGANEGFAEENVLLASSMTNQQLMDNGNRMMDETDQAIERGKKVGLENVVTSFTILSSHLEHIPFASSMLDLNVVQETITVGTETAAALKAQTEQMSRIVNELDSIHFSIKRASQLVATDKCIMGLLFLIVAGVVAIIIVKLVHPNNKDIRDIPGLAPPAMNRRLLWSQSHS